jgi:hypothetical protein
MNGKGHVFNQLQEVNHPQREYHSFFYTGVEAGNGVTLVDYISITFQQGVEGLAGA